ncbi:MAG: 2'-deoxycytidine 5'-triphosphate deaminase [Candidatus Dormibacteraeota bacterium]|nr:2'-deoxycytidine 5'-triphosphate deaminase [Candidatus Dormibacteraeota bacterium]
MPTLHLPSDAEGVLPSQLLSEAIDSGVIEADYKVRTEDIQPASLDLRLGETAYRIRCSFLPGSQAVEPKLKNNNYIIDEIDLRRDGAVLETNRPYLIPLIEELNLPPNVRGRTNPKSSTGRLDVFTRVITDYSDRFDEIAPGYQGKLYLEVVPLSFTVRVRHKLALNQLRLAVGTSVLTDEELRSVHAEDPILFKSGRAVGADNLHTSGGLFLTLDLQGDERGCVGYRAKDPAPLLDMARTEAFRPTDYWEPVYREGDAAMVLAPGKFYLLLSEESIRIPPGYAAEMTAYDPTSGELRTHYAGFFDPGFGYDTHARFFGSRAALEVRAHDVPFMIEHDQRVCKLIFERMAMRPKVLYGEDIGSAYQEQVDALSKHFVRSPRAAGQGATDLEPYRDDQPDLFSSSRIRPSDVSPP